MELIIIVTLLATVITNLMTFRIVKKLQLLPQVELVPTILESIKECNCGTWLTEEVKEIKEIVLPKSEEVSVKISPTPDDSYHAWTNHVEEPVLASPSPHGPPPIPEPLARPYGFSR